MRVPGLGSTINRRRRTVLAIALALTGATALAGCGKLNTSETLARGYVLPAGALEQIPIVLGTPSTVATINGDVFYYISQRSERSAAFMPYRVVDQRVVAVYFDKDKRVVRLANYGLKDGKIFDFVSGKTETGGNELNYLRGIFKNVGFNPFGG